MERELGVTYKQAHKMMQRIRTEQTLFAQLLGRAASG